ncbi:response regulator transcription factor [Nonomuraea sp. NPDC050663]|uniref:response regulator transcription factor n=1 Tax=Nonomuraea sp. NPDC050663 TaxID=3364370 RepID=UPI003799F8C5
MLIVDDHAGFRSSARALLEADGFDVVGEAATAEEALDEVARVRPGVVLLDIHLPDADGFAVACALAGTAQPPDVVLISSREAVTFGPRLPEATTRGFLPKHRLSGAAIRALLD